MKLEKFKVGYDNGNGNSKIVINSHYTEQPNVIYERGVAKPDTSAWDISAIKNLKENLIIGYFKESTNILGLKEKNEIIYHIGNCALRSGRKLQGLNIESEKDKVNNEITIITTLGYIAAEVINDAVMMIEKETDKDFEINDIKKLKEMDLEVDVNLATSIPISYYSKELALKLVSKFKNKGEAFTVNIYIPEQESVTIKIKFLEVDVEKEGVTSAYFLANATDSVFAEYNKEAEEYNKNVIDENKKMISLNKEFFKDPNNIIMHVAIGEGTTEFPRTAKYNWLPEYKTGTFNGIGHAMVEAVEFLKDIPGTQDILEPRKLSNIVRNKLENDINHRFFEEIVSNLSSPISRQANEIIEKIESELRRSQVQLLCVYGGGSILMKYALNDKLKEICAEKRIPLLYIPAKDAVRLEVLGLYTKVSAKNFKGL